MFKQTTQFPYRLPFKALLVYYTAMGLALWLMLNRNKPQPWSSLPAFMSIWGQHASNFALTFLLLTSIGMFWVLQAYPRKAYLWLAGVFVAMNIIVELFVPVLNTPDAVDIPFGVAGVAAGLGVLYLLNKLKTKKFRTKVSLGAL